MKLVLKTVSALCLVATVWWLTTTAGESQNDMQIDFDDTLTTPWRTVNDTVMGGTSQSTFSITPNNTGVFSGDLSLENNGGFSSVRRPLTAGELAGAEAVVLRVKGDDRPYQLRLRMNRRENAVSYRSVFDTTDGEWMTIRLPLQTFEPVFRGRMVEDAPELVAGSIQEIGLFLADNQPGDFRLEVDWIRAE